jgi:Fe-S-cluster-containing dehydrogenase component
MTARISRRLFLKGGFAACAAVASGISENAYAGEAQIATLLDISKCIGCGACVEACGETNAAKYPEPKKPFPKMYPDRAKPEDWSEKRDVNNRLTPYNWLYIQSADVTVNGEEKTITIPRRCMHCTNPPCVKLCPWGSAKQLENGTSRIDPDLCLGGAKCRDVCPWEIPQRQTGVGLYLDILPAFAGNGVMYKCDRCYNRIAEGKTPACIEVCPERVQEIGPRDEIIKKAHTLAKEKNGYIYGENENGGTNTIYVSPVPFDVLNKAIETGKGKPHLKAVSDSMEKANNLVAGMAIAPIAGIAAAVGTFYKYSKKESENIKDGKK